MRSSAREISMRRACCWPLMMTFVAFCGSASAAERDAYPADPEMPAFTLPDPLVAASGQKITTAEQWKSIRRPEVLELFREHVYGRVPPTPYKVSYKIEHEDRQAIGGKATLKQVAIEIAHDSK